MYLKIKKEEVEGILNYLAKRPYEDVWQGINILGTLKPCKCEEEKKKEETPK